MRFALAMSGNVLPAAALLLLCVLGMAAPVEARDSLGVYGRWGAFRDADVPRCFAIAEPARRSDGAGPWKPFAAIGYWPRTGIRGQVHVRLSRDVAPRTAITIGIGDRRFAMIGGGADAWAADKRGDAAIVAAMRSGTSMSVSARARDGSSFADVYALPGAATAIDAAALGCGRIR